MQDLIAENEKLREIEEQFWVLLQEHETLEKRLQTNTSAQLEPRAEANSAEVERITEALREALELLLARERGESIAFSRGPVAAFLSWCEIEEVKKEARGTTITSTSPSGAAARDLVPGMEHEVHALRSKVRDLEKENTQLQEELDRVDLSRIQALEDADRMQRQVASLSESIVEIRAALNSERARAEKHASEAAKLPQVRARLAERDGEIAELAAELERVKRIGDVAGIDLAADAARIREDLEKRRGVQ
uniref:Uncharacterized protein n=1 Tax=Neobodo designis TaxID=312471 RepID=A0A7S1R116_NEODS|mmetsp:Transcript_5876/g.18527  ORF Transcript_5876/g.18527 Transcript_5876/m.18527 type:complete len:250 (+) Transcript_5876:40-789(+)